MSIDVSTPEDKRRELANFSLMQAKKNLERTLEEVNYLINATPTSARRTTFTDAAMHLMIAGESLNSLQSIEKETK